MHHLHRHVSLKVLIGLAVVHVLVAAYFFH